MTNPGPVFPDFELALRAFGMFTTAEKLAALQEFARLRYPHVEDRIFAAVHHVIESNSRRSGEDDGSAR